jgi:phosphate transport system permease protein
MSDVTTEQREPRTRIAHPPAGFELLADRTMSFSTVAFCGFTIGLVGLLLIILVRDSLPALREDGLSLLYQSEWNPVQQVYGLFPAIVGTLNSSLVALALAGVFGVAIAIFLTEAYLPDQLTAILKNIVDLLAAIPSVVYGLWGLVAITPLLQPLSEWLFERMPDVPFFSKPLGVGGLAPASLVLAIMILPTVAAISRDALAAVHPRVKEAAYGLGATRWQVIFRVVLPTASGGIFGGLVLGFGRALGETMALAMLMGNRNELSWSLFAPGNTLAALIANSYKEATGDLVPRLIYAALVLLIITMIVNLIGGFILQHTAARLQGGKK